MSMSFNNYGLLFKEKRSQLAAGVLLLHDNASVHKFRVAQS